MLSELEVINIQSKTVDIITVTVDGMNTALNLNLPILCLSMIAFIIVFILFRIAIWGGKGFKAEEITITEPFTKTKIKIKANIEDKKVAHRIWTELITRKAALPFQRKKDVIIDVYDSWHTLFQCIREQISLIPVEKLNGRQKIDTEKLIDISTKVLNEGLRPHLTEWQAKYRKWYEVAKEDNNKSPQEIQEDYPCYEQLVSDLESVNVNLSIFADELKKIVRA
jgi:hypothetical protein